MLNVAITIAMTTSAVPMTSTPARVMTACEAAEELSRLPLNDATRTDRAASFVMLKLTREDDCFAPVTAALRAAAVDHHRRFQKEGDPSDLIRAAVFYDALFAVAGVDAEARVRFFHAEALWDLGRWREAGVAYHDVVTHAPSSEYAPTAAYNRVLAWDNAVRKKPSRFADPLAKLSRGSVCTLGPRRFEMTEDEEELLAALVDYREALESAGIEDERLPFVMLREAHLRYEHLRPAEAGLRKIIARWPSSEAAAKAQEALFDQSGSYDALEAELRAAEADPRFVSNEHMQSAFQRWHGILRQGRASLQRAR